MIIFPHKIFGVFRIGRKPIEIPLGLLSEEWIQILADYGLVEIRYLL
jgi:hypothetical protein